MTTQEQRELGELDAWIAEHVMGWTKCSIGHLEHAGRFAVQRDGIILIHNRGKVVKTFHPTTDPAASREVEKKCLELLESKYQSSAVV